MKGSGQSHRGRIILSVVFLALGMIILGGKFVYLQILSHEKPSRVYQRKFQGGRGLIYDRHGNSKILVMNVPSKDVCVDPSVLLQEWDSQQVASMLAPVLEVPVEQVALRLNRPGSRYERLQRFVPEETTRQVQAMKFPGVFLQDAPRRYYPHGSMMCHVLGFVNHEGVGSSGVEQRMDDYLKGCWGFVESRKNALQEELILDRTQYVRPLDGAHLILTIDQNVQFLAEQALDEVMQKYRAKGAWAIVERCRTGEILALASRPSYDLNNFQSATTNEKLNRAIGYVYEPGSTLKAVTIAAALNERIVTRRTIINCENGHWNYARRPLREAHGGGYGFMTVEDVLKKSSNIGTAKVGLLLGNRKLEGYLRNFGMGRRLGIELPGEEVGILHSQRYWTEITPTRVAIGQGVAVTALQVLGVYCAIANGGYLMRPYLVRRVEDSEGSPLFETQPQILSRPISSGTADLMRQLLSRVTEEGGTGTKAQVDGYEVAGKTGTAQKPEKGRYVEKFVASFVGFLPVEDPEIGIIVVVDEPQGAQYGGVVAAPAFSRIASQALCYLDPDPQSKSAVARNRREDGR